MKAAILDSKNIVQNIIMWDDTCSAPEGYRAVPLDDAVYVSIGFEYVNGEAFIDPTPAPPPEGS